MAIIVERTEANLTLELDIDRAGGVTGAAPTVALRDGDTNASYLDFADGVFKTSGWATRKAALTEISASLAPGRYVRRVNLSTVTIPAATSFLVAEYENATASANGIASDVLILVNTIRALASAAALSTAQADLDDVQTRLPAALVGGRIDASVGAMEADTVTASALAASAVSEISADTNSVLTGSHGAGAWTSDGPGLTAQQVRDAMKLAPTGGAPAAGSVDGHLDEIEADAAAMQPTIATNLDAAITTRATQAQILSDATPFQGGRIDAAITSRPTAAQIDAELTSTHGAGSWAAGGGLTTQDVRDAMKLAPTGGAPVAGSIDLALDNIEADTAAMQPTIAANLDAAITSRPTAAQIDAELTSTHGAGAWTGGGGLTAQQVRDAMALAPSPGVPAVGSIDESLELLALDVAALLARLTALRAAALDEVTPARLAELDAGNMPAESAATLARVDHELVRIHTYLGLLVGTPAVHTPASVTAGGIAQTVGVAGSTVTKTATT